MGNAIEKPRNLGLLRLHRVFYLAYFGFFAILVLIGLVAMLRQDGEDAIGFIGVGLLLSPMGILHWFAAKGARLGKSYGRTASRVIAVFLFLGFPIGTIVAIFIFSRVGKQWHGEFSGAANS